MAKELRELGWVKEDYSDRVDKYIDFTFLAKGPDGLRLSFDMVVVDGGNQHWAKPKESRAALLSPQAGRGSGEIYRNWFALSTPDHTARVPNTAGPLLSVSSCHEKRFGIGRGS